MRRIFIVSVLIVIIFSSMACSAPQDWPAPWLNTDTLTIGDYNPYVSPAHGYDAVTNPIGGTWEQTKTGAKYSIDFLGKGGEPLFSPVRGRIICSNMHADTIDKSSSCANGHNGKTFGAYGNHVIIEPEGDPDNTFIMAHLSNASIEVFTKLLENNSEHIVEAGQQIGYLGNSGGWPNMHLHFELKNRSYTLRDTISLFGITEAQFKSNASIPGSLILPHIMTEQAEQLMNSKPMPQVGVPYDFDIPYEGTQPMKTWYCDLDKLPDGIKLIVDDEQHLHLAGTPTKEGKFEFIIDGENAVGRGDGVKFTMFVDPAPVVAPPAEETPPDSEGKVHANLFKDKNMALAVFDAIVNSLPTSELDKFLIKNIVRIWIPYIYNVNASAEGDSEGHDGEDGYYEETYEYYTADDFILTPEIIAQVKELDLSGRNISSLVGINYFTSLEKLTCSNNNLTTLNVTGCKNLKKLYCSYNNITNLYVNGCTKLETLECTDNNITGVIDVSGCVALKDFNCTNNHLNWLNINGCANLETLLCSYNDFGYMNVQGFTKLTTLECYSENLKTLHVTNCPVLTGLYVPTTVETLYLSGCSSFDDQFFHNFSYNRENLKNLTVTNCDALTYFSIGNNLIRLNLSNNKALKNVYGGSSLEELTLANCPELEMVRCEDSKLTKLDVKSSTNLKELYLNNDIQEIICPKDLIPIDAVHFPSEIFRNTARSFTGGNFFLTNSKISEIRNLSFNNSEIYDLTGIEYFTDLEELYCYDTKLTKLDVSRNEALRRLTCDSSDISELDLSKNPNLFYLNCSKNKLTKLDLSNNKCLQELYCNNNQIEELNIANGEHRSFDVYCDLNIAKIICNDGDIPLDVSHFPDSEFRRCLYELNNYTNIFWHNTNALDNIVSIDVSHYYYGSDNKNYSVKDLKGVEYFKNLEELYCYNNYYLGLGNFDVSSNTKLKKLVFNASEDLTKFDVSNNGELVELHINGTKISKLDLSNNRALRIIKLYDVPLTELDLSQNLLLEDVTCSGCLLKKLDLSNHTTLKDLKCYFGHLEEINLANCIALEYLDCRGNDIKTLDFHDCSQLMSLRSDFNIKFIAPEGYVILDAEHFPDENFRSYLIQRQTDTYLNGFDPIIYNPNHASVGGIIAYGTDLNISGLNITDLTGIEYFQLSYLYCYDNNITKLDLSSQYSLKGLDCHNNSLRELILPDEGGVRLLNCENNPALKELDISAHNSLIWSYQNESTDYEYRLFQYDNGLNVITGNNKKVSIYILDETIFPDRLFRNYLLENFDTDGNSYLDENEILNIKSIDVSGLGISSLDGIEYLTALEELYCSRNMLTKLDLSKNSALRRLDCEANELTELVLGEQLMLEHINCMNNYRLQTLDISHCPDFITIEHDIHLDIFDGKIKPSFTTHALVLSGQIGAFFYMDLPEISGVDYSQAYMKFDILGDTESNNPQMFDPEVMNAKGTYYGFVCYVNSVQMADPILATLYYGDWQRVEHFYSVKEYLDTIIERTASESMRELAKAMKDYGHYMQVYLARKNGWEIGVKHVAMDYANIYSENDIEDIRQKVSDYAIVRDTGNSGIEKVTFALELDSETIIDVYLKLKDGYNGAVEAYLDDSKENIATLQPDGRYLVQISGVSAHLLGNTYTIHVNAGEKFDVKVSALSYVNSILNAASSAKDIKEAVASLYNYFDATMSYRRSIGQ